VGFLITLLYVALSHLSPADLFPDLVDSRIMLWLALAAVVASAPAIFAGKFPFRAPQVYLMLGLIVAVPLSRVAHLWFGGAFPALEGFLTAGVVFYLVVANVTTLARLRVLIVVFLSVCLFLLYRAVAVYYSGDLENVLLYRQGVHNPATGGYANPLIRIHALGFLSDPNDFAQCLLTALPFLGLAWRSGRHIRNFLFVLAPAGFILYGVYLTHSRGGAIGLGMILLLVCLPRLGKTRSIICAVLLVGLLISPLSGGRDTSINSINEGRVMEWGAGIAMLKANPLFGVGYGEFLDHEDLTAHNSFVLCFSELGLFGYFFWLGLIVYTVTDLNATIRALEQSGENEDRLRYAKVLRVSLFAFLTTAWFLSRTYTVTLYLVLGMIVAFIRMPKEEAEQSASVARSQWRLTAALELGSLILVYVFVRLRALT
jgi:O-antigen ligase/polysaccharide polymerase Wzy-like membrane protein